MIEYSFNKGVLYVVFKSIVNFNDILDFLKEFSKIKAFPRNLLVIYDLQDADLKIKQEDIKKISYYSEQATERYKSVKTAFLVNKPKLTAYSMLFSNFADQNKTQRKIFSTEQAALKWLLQN